MLSTEEQSELHKLRDENQRLKTLLTRHGIAWKDSLSADSRRQATQILDTTPETTRYSTADKISLFRRLFRGRIDVYPQRWESTKGRSGYSPVCTNEWKKGICLKPKIKCGDCSNRTLQPINDHVIYNHLAGKCTIGVYPLLTDNYCYFLAIDFDDASWRKDTKALMQTCNELAIPSSVEISRSGKGAHIWIFFAVPVSARDARHLGAALISRTCDRTHQLSLESYDRLFPNQDILPNGGFGNLIALPLQKNPREQGNSCFVDEQFTPYHDQWAYLATIELLSKTQLDDAIIRATNNRHPLDVSFNELDEISKPWQQKLPAQAKILGSLPESLTLVLANEIFIAKEELPQPLANRLIRLAAFQNPEFHKAQAMRLPVWNKPRIIGCAENHPQHIGLPRGCLDSILELLRSNGIQTDLLDERLQGKKIKAKFIGTLRKDQKKALREIFKHETGVFCAPTAFGKTITAAALIAKRKVSTLVLVHRTELLRQWQERLTGFLEIDKNGLGVIGGGKKKPTGSIDVAVIQSLSRYEDLASLLDKYGQIIVDECHHLSAFSFEAIIKQAKAKHVLGLTATPIRRDGHQPIIFMQCGPIRHQATSPESAPKQLEVWPRKLPSPRMDSNLPIQDVFRTLVTDEDRNRRIAKDVLAAYKEGRKILILTERTEHLSLLQNALNDQITNCFILHGRLSKKQRSLVLTELEALNKSAPRVLLATGRLIGEGFDHPPLDTLILTMPISWKGTLQQYAGRLHREHADKKDVRIFDYVETDHPQLERMWNKRKLGYRAMGYKIKHPDDGSINM